MKHPFLCGALGAAVALTVFSSVSSARAYVTKHTPSGATVHWREASITWSLDRTVDDVPGGAKAFRDGVAAWNAAGEASAHTPAMRVATAKQTRSPGLDGVSGLYYVKDGFAPAGRALAVTILHIDDATGEIIDADVVLNGVYDLEAVQGSHSAAGEVVDEHDATPGEIFDVRRVAAHELGHALGLADAPDDADALMYPFVTPNTALGATPRPDDVSGLSSIYASGAQPATTTPSSPHGCALAPARAIVPGILAASVLALALALRSRRLALGTFAALLAAPPLVGSPPARVRVAHVRTISDAGIFRSELELTNGAHLTVWGGVLGGIRQEIGGSVALREGDVVETVKAPNGAFALRRAVE